MQLVGNRVTLTYSILVVDKEPAGQRGYGHCKAEVLTTSGVYEPETRIPRILSEILHELPADGHVGIFLSHAHTNSGLLAQNLKGADKLLFDHLVQQNVPVSLVPVVSSYSFERYDGEYAECNDGNDGPPEFPVRLIQGFSDPRIEEHKSISNAIPFISGWPVKGVCVRDEERQCAHTGNEVDPHSVDKIYIKGAMIVGPAPPVDVGSKARVLDATEQAEEHSEGPQAKKVCVARGVENDGSSVV
eukprot:gene21580-27618_t